jgi:uncharacterized protein YjbJ (UPF0337 family)
MTISTEKIKGVANQVSGKIKEQVGRVIGNEKLQSDGMAQHAKGQVQQRSGDRATDVEERDAKKSDE